MSPEDKPPLEPNCRTPSFVHSPACFTSSSSGMADDLRNTGSSKPPKVDVLPSSVLITPVIPTKKINDGPDLSFFLNTKAYADIMTFILQLNHAMVPTQSIDVTGSFQAWPTDSSEIHVSPTVASIGQLVSSMKSLMNKAPPQTGPRRFGNAAFRTWYSLVKQETPRLLRQYLPSSVWEHVFDDSDGVTLEKELELYLLGSLGSPERLDYGTGHELSFLAFLICVWKLGGFADSASGNEERAIVVAVINPYLDLIRSLILTYTLEPAGSHGVWGLDDHSFIPYVLGSAQLSPPVKPGVTLPTVGSLKGAPSPDRAVKADSVDMYRTKNLYFAGIGFILDVKKGPFWEHSPTLYDISGIKDGWAKINKGMVKMYNAEVLSKFPVVQHLYFGSLLSWEQHPLATMQEATTHIKAQPQRGTAVPSNGRAPAGTAAPWAGSQGGLPSMQNATRFPTR